MTLFIYVTNLFSSYYKRAVKHDHTYFIACIICTYCVSTVCEYLVHGHNLAWTANRWAAEVQGIINYSCER